MGRPKVSTKQSGDRTIITTPFGKIVQHAESSLSQKQANRDLNRSITALNKAKENRFTAPKSVKPKFKPSYRAGVYNQGTLTTREGTRAINARNANADGTIIIQKKVAKTTLYEVVTPQSRMKDIVSIFDAQESRRRRMGLEGPSPETYIKKYVPDYYKHEGLKILQRAKDQMATQERLYLDAVKEYETLPDWMKSAFSQETFTGRAPGWLSPDAQYALFKSQNPFSPDEPSTSSVGWTSLDIKQKVLEKKFFSEVKNQLIWERDPSMTNGEIILRKVKTSQLPTKDAFYSFLVYQIASTYEGLRAMFPEAGSKNYGVRYNGVSLTNSGQMRNSFLDPGGQLTPSDNIDSFGKTVAEGVDFKLRSFAIRADKNIATNKKTGMMYWDILNERDTLWGNKANPYRGFVQKAYTALADSIREYADKNRYDPISNDKLEDIELEEIAENENKVASGIFESVFGTQAD